MKAVLDTNVVVSALLFERGRLAWVREAWTAARITPLIDRPCLDELLRVLAYPKFRLGEDEIRALLGGYLPYVSTVDTDGASTRGLPRVADGDDRKFLLLAREGNAEVLVTGDTGLLELDGTLPFAVTSPSTLRARLDEPSS